MPGKKRPFAAMNDANSENMNEESRKRPKFFDRQSIKAIHSNIFNTISDKSLHDVTFQITGNGGLDDTEFTGIKYLFSAQSPVFKNMLHGHMKESSSDNVIIEDISPIAFSHIREYCHMSKPEIEYKDICDVLYSSQKYMISNLIKLCHDKIMKINNINDFFVVMMAFSKYAPVTFQPFIDAFVKKSSFVSKNIEKIVEENEFYHLVVFQVQSIMKSDKLKNSYDAAKRYCMHHQQKNIVWEEIMRKHFVEYINFAWLKSLYLLQTVRNDNVLSESKLLDALSEKKFNKINSSGFSMKNITLTYNEMMTLKIGKNVDFRDESGKFMSVKMKEISYLDGIFAIKLESENDPIKEIHLKKRCILAYYGSITTRNETKKPCMRGLQVGAKLYVNFKHLYGATDESPVDVDIWVPVAVERIVNETCFGVKEPKNRGLKRYFSKYDERKILYFNTDSHDECACSKYCKSCKIFWE